MSEIPDPENMILKHKRKLFTNRVDLMNDSKPMFPVLSKKDEPNPMFPRITEIMGIKPLLPDNLSIVNELRRKNIPAIANNDDITENRLFNYRNQMDSTIDIINKLRLFKPF